MIAQSLDLKDLIRFLGGGLGCNLCFYYSSGCQAFSGVFTVVWRGPRGVSCHLQREAGTTKDAEKDGVTVTLKVL